MRNRAVSILILVLLLGPAAFAQAFDTSPDARTGRVPFASYFNSDIDSISLYNGNLLLDITLFAQPGRELSTGLRLTYNSQKWQQYTPNFYTYGVYTGGWRIHGPVGGEVVANVLLQTCDGGVTGTWTVDGYWIDGVGTVHHYVGNNLIGNCEDAPSNANLSLYPDLPDGSILATDSNGNPRVQFKDGSIVVGETGTSRPRFTTPNGNYVEEGINSVTGRPSRIPMHDTLGRTITFSTTRSGAVGVPECISSAPSPSTYQDVYTIKDATGNSQSYTLHYQYNHGLYNPIDSCWMAFDSWLTSIDLPNSQSYVFAYDHEQGYLTKVTLPSGGYIKYAYYGGNSDHSAADDYVVERRVSADGSIEQVWTYARSTSGGNRILTVTSPESHEVTHTFNSLGQETEAAWRTRAGETPLQIVRTPNWTNGRPDYVETESGTVKKKSEFTWSGDNLTEQKDSDWYPVNDSLVPKTKATYTYVGLNSFDRVSDVYLEEYLSGSYTGAGRTKFCYDESGSVITTTSSSTVNKGTPLGDRGNVSTIRRYYQSATVDACGSSTNGGYVEEHFFYDDLGNVVQHVDPLSHATTFTYTDSFNSTGHDPTYAFPTQVTNALSQHGSMVYNWDTGLLVSSTDPRSYSTSFTYDLMNRPATITAANGQLTTVEYTDSTTPKVLEKVHVDSSNERKVETTFDRLNRPVKVKLADPDGDIFAETEYDGDGRVRRVSEPYRSGSPAWTETHYDGLSRAVRIVHPDNSEVAFDYDGSTVTTIDEAGTPWVSEFNALGQLTRVVEPLNGTPETTYTYYAAGPLKSVSQPSVTQQSSISTRTFAVDWLGRLTSETHPESGQTDFTYYANGLLHTRTDARNKTATYTYDNVDRLTGIDYSDSTPDVSFGYDASGYTGFLTSTAVSGVASSSFAYNTVGLISQETVTFSGISNSVTPCSGITGGFASCYSYDLDGRLTSVTYPSGRTVSRTYDSGSGTAVDRIQRITDDRTSTTVLQGVLDTPAGLLAGRTLGSTVQEIRGFNTRNQLTGIAAAANGTSVLDLSYGYGALNTGRISSRTDVKQPEHSTNYSYDPANRLTGVAAQNGSWGIDWTLDQYGNRTHQAPSGLTAGLVGAPYFDYSNNHVSAASSYSYDAAGNLLQDGTGTGTHSYSYDAESRLTAVDTTAVQFFYDATGRRIAKTVGSTTTFYLYGLTGLMSEFTNASGVAQAATTDRLEYRVPEQTGTGVLLVAPNGLVTENNRLLPFGELWQSTLGSTNDQNFTTYDRDATSDLDYAMARMYRSREGRFLTPDPGHVGGNVGDPQSWNAYAYGAHDPIDRTDPSGLEYDICFYGFGCTTISDDQYDQYSRQNGLVDFPRWGLVGFGQTGTIECNNTNSTSTYVSVVLISECGFVYRHQQGGIEDATFGLLATLDGAQAASTLIKAGIRIAARAFAKRSATESATALATRLGKAGERAANIVKNTRRVPSQTGASYRIPDVLNLAEGIIGEVKNVASLSYTNQLRDFAAFAEQNGLRFELTVRSGTQLSGPLQEAVRKGNVILKYLP